MSEDRKAYVERLKAERAAVEFRANWQPEAVKQLADIDAELAKYADKPAKRGKPEKRA